MLESLHVYIRNIWRLYCRLAVKRVRSGNCSSCHFRPEGHYHVLRYPVAYRPNLFQQANVYQCPCQCLTEISSVGAAYTLTLATSNHAVLKPTHWRLIGSVYTKITYLILWNCVKSSELKAETLFVSYSNAQRYCCNDIADFK